MLEAIRFLLDEHVPAAVATGLRQKGIEAATVSELGRGGFSDTEQIRFASDQRWVFVTFDSDYLACALAQKACRLGFTTSYVRAPRFFQDLTVARLNGSYSRWLARLAKFNLLVLDDFALVPVSEEQCRDLLEVTDDRCGKNSLIIASQLPVENWYQTFANKTLADAILDRVVHESYRLSLQGDSLRKKKKKNEDPEQKS